MNVFILCTGRCGSTTFIKAATHIKNFTAAHESRCKFIGNARFFYPQNHIEADNRLSWFLGRLDAIYGCDAWYVHLQRDVTKTAQSFMARGNRGIMKAYRSEIIMGAGDCKNDEDKLHYCIDYCETVNANIRAFLKDKTNKINFKLECAERDWPMFWAFIKAEGDYDRSLKEWEIRYNAR